MTRCTSPDNRPAQLPIIRRSVREGIVKPIAVPFRGIDKSVQIFLDIYRLEKQAPVAYFFGVFDQNSRRTIDAPHPESGPEKSAIRIKLLQPCHRMETIDRDTILAIKA